MDALTPLFAQAGAAIISFHPEASEHVDRSLQLIRSFGIKAGLVLNPATPLPKTEAVRRLIDASGRDIWLEVDDGVKADNARRIAAILINAQQGCAARQESQAPRNTRCPPKESQPSRSS